MRDHVALIDVKLAGCDLAQRNHDLFVAVEVLDQLWGASKELLCALGRDEHEREAVGDVLQAVLNGDASHGGLQSPEDGHDSTRGVYADQWGFVKSGRRNRWKTCHGDVKRREYSAILEIKGAKQVSCRGITRKA
uniref:Uncharacterized protein n=1 Tax=uncultured delta proteobacterium HF0010_01J10 TaxID=710820 RepID=E0XQF3_9DELT|nr:hypothetical protein [uncultured delta proteobacterium HF0010_01J10]